MKVKLIHKMINHASLSDILKVDWLLKASQEFLSENKKLHHENRSVDPTLNREKIFPTHTRKRNGVKFVFYVFFFTFLHQKPKK